MPTAPLNALRVFEAVARAGSFREAAGQLNVTQSAISHQIRHLEDWLGGALFERQGNRTHLLPHGRDLARSLSNSLGEIDAACARARAGGASRPLVIAAIPSIAMCWLIPRLDGFRKAHAEIETRVIYAMHGRDINFRDTDIAFVYASAPPRLPGVKVLPFLPGHSVPVCSPALVPDRQQADFDPVDIRNLALLHDAETSGWQEWLSAAGLSTVPPVSGAIFEDFNLLRAAALSGQGAALCASAVIRPDLEAGRLVQLSDRSIREDHAYYMLLGPGRTAPAEAFSSWALAARDPHDQA